MAEWKTKESKSSVAAFLAAIPDPQRRDDALAVAAMMKAATKTEPRMWGTSIVGYGAQHYKYESGREGDWFRIGFSPRKDALTVLHHQQLRAVSGADGQAREVHDGKVLPAHQTAQRCRREGVEAADHPRGDGAAPRGKTRILRVQFCEIRVSSPHTDRARAARMNGQRS